MIYQFTDIRSPAMASDGLDMTFNGQGLRTFLANSEGDFRVLTIAGRGLVKHKHQTTDVIGRHGLYFHRSTVEARTLTVKVLLTARTDQLFRRRYEKLNALLNTPKPSYLSFSDDPDRFYLAKFSDAQTGDELANSAVLTLNFVCFDPFKFSGEKTVSGTVVNYSGSVASKPIVTITLQASGSEFRLLHAEKQLYIRLIGTFTAGQVIKIDMATGAITINGRNALGQFDMVNSRYFSLSPGVNTLSTNLTASISTTYREVYL